MIIVTSSFSKRVCVQYGREPLRKLGREFVHLQIINEGFKPKSQSRKHKQTSVSVLPVPKSVETSPIGKRESQAILNA